ncbi:hypothetical protein niasHT_034543 [Heterodera trifolii]|uniref:Uncharacterized protein n=1 Tax=Heterodera trifolii TaxID=157864 RepID=A0ABD2I586_9BILA
MANKLHKESALLRGQSGLTFINAKTNKMKSCFNEHTETEFAKAGAVASADISLRPAQCWRNCTCTAPWNRICAIWACQHGSKMIFRRASTNISLPAGPMPGGIALARRHGTEVAKVGHGHTDGKWYNLLEEFNVCKTDEQLSADQARILKQFGQRLAQFCVRLLAR